MSSEVTVIMLIYSYRYSYSRTLPGALMDMYLLYSKYSCYSDNMYIFTDIDCSLRDEYIHNLVAKDKANISLLNLHKILTDKLGDRYIACTNCANPSNILSAMKLIKKSDNCILYISSHGIRGEVIIPTDTIVTKICSSCCGIKDKLESSDRLSYIDILSSINSSNIFMISDHCEYTRILPFLITEDNINFKADDIMNYLSLNIDKNIIAITPHARDSKSTREGSSVTISVLNSLDKNISDIYSILNNTNLYSHIIDIHISSPSLTTIWSWVRVGCNEQDRIHRSVIINNDNVILDLLPDNSVTYT